jgi:predicted nucleic acid-binding protein
MIIVSNTTPLIGLAVIQHYDLLRQMFSTITIAPAVWDEAVTAGREAGGARAEVARP